MLLQGKKAASFARKPDPDVWAVLAFGEDEGLASDNGQPTLPLILYYGADLGIHSLLRSRLWY